MNDKPAFPCVPGTGTQDGMTLRQWYAGMAMQGLMANELWDIATHEKIAQAAFGQADAMLAELEKDQ